MEAIGKIITYGFIISKPSQNRPELHDIICQDLQRFFRSTRHQYQRLVRYPTHEAQGEDQRHQTNQVQQERGLSMFSSEHSFDRIPSISRSNSMTPTGYDDNNDNNMPQISSSLDETQHPPWSPRNTSPTHSINQHPFVSRRSLYESHSSRPLHRKGEDEEVVSQGETISSSGLNRTSSFGIEGDHDYQDSHQQNYQCQHLRHDDFSPTTSRTSHRILSPSVLIDNEVNFLKISHCAYLRSLSNVFDLVAISAYWIDLVLMLSTDKTWSLFKAIGATRLLRLVFITEGTAVRISLY